MRATTILAFVANVAALGAVTSLIPLYQVSAQVGGPPSSPPNSHAVACAGAAHLPFCPKAG